MGYYSRKRNIRRFWKNPLPNLCYVLSVLAFVAGLFGLFALMGKADTLVFTIVMLVAGVLLIVLGNKINARLKEKKQDSDSDSQ